MDNDQPNYKVPRSLAQLLQITRTAEAYMYIMLWGLWGWFWYLELVDDVDDVDGLRKATTLGHPIFLTSNLGN